VGEQILKSLRMSSLFYHITAIDYLPVSMGFSEADAHYIVPIVSDDDYLKKIIDICKKEKVQVLIPGSEPELKKISENRKLFEQNNILLLINEKKVIDVCMDKLKTHKFLKKNNLGYLPSYFIERENQLSKIKKFPVVIKPVRGGGGSSNVFIAQDKKELQFFTKYLLKQKAIPIVQDYVGSVNEEYTVGVLTSFKGTMIGSIAVKRQILSGLSNKIKIKNRYKNRIKDDILAISSGVSQGFIDDYPEVCQFAEKVALKLNSKGPLNIQCRKVKNKIFIFEINPRFSGTTSIRALVGYNEPDILIRHELLKEKISKSIRFKKGIVMRGLKEKYLPTNINSR
ncbi:MAG: ATP-grasp domain-containing protein, partial [Candidatus Pacebacteria bacterium]|nr:ATP-grasp domain-containing protein [Candidatus Paceibacterota bacterium]